MKKGDPSICEACDGTGEIIFAITDYAPGCGFSHESSDGRPCEECGGTGRTPNWPTREDGSKKTVGEMNRDERAKVMAAAKERFRKRFFAEPSHQERVPDDDLPF